MKIMSQCNNDKPNIYQIYSCWFWGPWHVSGSGICDLVTQGIVAYIACISIMILCLPFVTDMCLCCIEETHNHVLWYVASPFPIPLSFCLSSFPVYASFCNPSIIQVLFCLRFFLCQVLLSRAWICCLVFPSSFCTCMGPTKCIWRIPSSQYLTLSLLFTALFLKWREQFSLLKISITLEEWKII